MPSLAVDLCGLPLKSPILSASGTFGHGTEMGHILPLERLGGLVSKTVTRRPRPGNPMPRIAETEAGFLNSIGLENRGVDSYIERTLADVAGVETMIFANIGGESVEDFTFMAAELGGREEIDAFEVNLSCPNVDGGRLRFSTDPELAEAVMRGVREGTDKPIFAKLSPNVTRIEEIAQAAVAGGADGLTAINTLLGMGVDWRRRSPALATVVGGYSGMGIKPVALRCAYQCAQAVDAPVIGCGGVMTAQDVLEFMVVGCTAVQVGTASFGDPALMERMTDELETLLEEAGVERVSELIGSLGQPRVPAAPGVQADT